VPDVDMVGWDGRYAYGWRRAGLALQHQIRSSHRVVS